MQSANPQAEVTSKITVEITPQANIIHKTPGLYSSSTHHKHPPKHTYFAMTTHDRNPSPTWAFSTPGVIENCTTSLRIHGHFGVKKVPFSSWYAVEKNRFNDPCNGKSLTEFSLQNEAIQNSSNFIDLNLGLGFIGGIGSSRLKRVIHWPQRSCSKGWADFLIKLPSSTGGALFLDFTCTLILRVFWRIPGLKLLFPQISCKWKMGTSETVLSL